jgi:hypothetical protein
VLNKEMDVKEKVEILKEPILCFNLPQISQVPKYTRILAPNIRAYWSQNIWSYGIVRHSSTINDVFVFN